MSTFDPTGIVAGDHPLTHEAVTIASGQTLVRGAVVGRITDSGKYILSLSGASDGSQTPVGVLAADCDASGGDKTAPVYFTGEFFVEKCTLGASHTITTVNAAWRAAGAALFLRKAGAVA